jgi:hypothetical protein
MARQKNKTTFNHKQRILGVQPVKVRSIYPGMILNFGYDAPNTSDSKPLVLVLWNDYTGHKIHGINLNYLQENRIKVMMQKVVKGAGVYSEDQNIITEDDQDSVNDYDDNLPYRNLLKEPFTRVNLPTFRERREGNPLSKAEAQKQMDMLYEKVLKKFINKSDMYRTYFLKKIRNMTAILYDIEGLLK